ncbi:MAG: radical SAM protein [Nanoarchaeota archaeon]|mgnify:CR=1 FL=1
MAQLKFATLAFEVKKEEFVVKLLNLFVTKIPLAELKEIGAFKLKDAHTLEFSEKNQKRAELKFSSILAKSMNTLTNSINGNKAIYIHQNSGIPLMGSVEFGIVYRNTSLIEIKPITSCNLTCIYCSVGEGKGSNKVDFVVEKDYLVEELQKLLDFVKEPVEVHIGVQGEPFLYADLLPLIKELNANKQITIVSMDTNFTLVTKAQIEELAKCKKLRLNISLDTLNPELANKMSGTAYNLKYVLEMIRYATTQKIKILIAPVLVPGYNEKDMEDVVMFVKELGLKVREKHPLVGIQNFLNYKTGRNPVQALEWNKFYQLISDLEKKSGMKLRLSHEDFGIRKTKELPKPFEVDEVVAAEIKCPDRFPNTVIAVAKNRCISVPECVFNAGKKIKVKITRDKHNVFGGKLVK